MEDDAVFLRKSYPAALALYLGFAGGASRGQEVPAIAAPSENREPSRLAVSKAENLPSSNQHIAEQIAERLRTSGRMQGYRIDIRFEDGMVELTGRVSCRGQRDEALRIVQAMPGVTRVHDMMEFSGNGIVQATDGPIGSLGLIPNKIFGDDGSSSTEPSQPTSDRTLQPPPLPGAEPQEPVSIMPGAPGFVPGMPYPTMQQPPLPPYAWPTYAPYNNYSRVAYPTNYPHEAFPFIGPMYPFPKVPLGWRAVSLRWQDGHWWYGREACGHDWWRIRYY
jgi:hypothetical protein